MPLWTLPPENISWFYWGHAHSRHGSSVDDRLRHRLITLLTLLILATTVGADTLDAVLERQRLVVGVRTDYPPFAYYKGTDGIVGFEVDIARALAEGLGVALELRPVTSLNRPALLGRGEADLVIATLVDRPRHRAQALLVKPGYYASGTSVLAWRGAHLERWADLEGRILCGIQGSPDTRRVREYLAVNILALVNTPAALGALKRRLCTALIHDSSVLISEHLRPEWRVDFFMPLPTLGAEPWRLAVAEGETRWAAWLARTLVQWHREGRLLTLEAAWHLPPSSYLDNMHRAYGHADPHP